MIPGQVNFMANTFYFNTINLILTSYIYFLATGYIKKKPDVTMEKSKKNHIYKKQYWIDKVLDQESSGPPWAVMPLEEEEHNIVTRQYEMSARSTYARDH